MKKIKFLLTLYCAVLLIAALTVGSFAAGLGDVDGDGKIAAADARLALRASVGLESFAAGSDKHIAADADHDGKITAADARLILRASVGLETFSEDKPEPKEPINPAHTHTFGAWQTEKKGTVTTGKHFRECTVCHTKETAACSYGKWAEATPATCTSAQVLSHSCSVCGGKQTKAGNPALGHIKATVVSSNPATCTANGTMTYKCSRCNKNFAEYPKALGHDFTAKDTSAAYLKSAATCTTPALSYYKCSRCGLKGTATFESTPALGHDYTVKNNVFGDNVKSLRCSRCNQTDNSLASFNQLVNAIKSQDYMGLYDIETGKWTHSVTYFTKTTMSSTCNTFDFEPILYKPMIKDLYDEEMNSDDISYTSIRTNSALYNLPVMQSVSMENAVSFLEEGDATINVKVLSGLNMKDILTGIDDKFTVGTKTYDTTGYKAKTFSGDILKITVKTAEEKFFGANGVSALADDKMTKLQKITGYDIRRDADEFGDDYTLSQLDQEEGVYKIGMDMKLNEITSGAAVDFYFNADDLSPIAILYNTDVVMSQDVFIDVQLFGSNLLHVTGHMDPVVNTNYRQIYLFSEYFN